MYKQYQFYSEVLNTKVFHWQWLLLCKCKQIFQKKENQTEELAHMEIRNFVISVIFTRPVQLVYPLSPYNGFPKLLQGGKYVEKSNNVNSLLLSTSWLKYQAFGWVFCSWWTHSCAGYCRNLFYIISLSLKKKKSVFFFSFFESMRTITAAKSMF